jgi:GNAT superfamily N-acetyltransferase
MIRPLHRNDYDQWLPLWQENCLGQITDDVTAETWRRLTNVKEPVFGLVAEERGTIAGLLHFILHPTTGQIEPVCYMQDLFIAEDYRRQGYARRLLWELHETGKKQGWARIYWVAERDNLAVQNLYKTLGILLDFTLHILPIQQGNTDEIHTGMAQRASGHKR